MQIYAITECDCNLFVEKSHLREAGLKEEISKLQEENIDLIAKLQIFKEEQVSASNGIF